MGVHEPGLVPTRPPDLESATMWAGDFSTLLFLSGLDVTDCFSRSTTPGIEEPNRISISSRARPLVSGTKKYDQVLSGISVSFLVMNNG